MASLGDVPREVAPEVYSTQNIPGMISVTQENIETQPAATRRTGPGEAGYSGRPIGPKVRLHRFDIGKRTLQTIGSIWLLGGFSFLFVVSLCCIVNIGFSTYKSQANVAFLPIIGFVLYTTILWSFLMTLMRTAVRMAAKIWNSHFGSSEEIYPLRWVDHAAGKYRLVDSEKKVETAKGVVLFFMLAIIVGIPLIVIASVFGYWAIVGYLFVALVLSSSIAILVTNIGARLVRTFYFLRMVFEDYSSESSHPRLRLAYLASSGLDMRNVTDTFSMRAVWISVTIMVWSFIFDPRKIVLATFVFGAFMFTVFFILRFRRFFCGCFDRCAKGSLSVDYNQIDAKRLNRAVTIVIIVRAIFYGLGLGALAYLDLILNQLVRSYQFVEAFSVSALIALLVVFYVAVVIQDILFVVPFLWPKLRAPLLGFLQVVQIVLAAVGLAVCPGYLFFSCLVISIHGMDFRDSRVYWTNPHLTSKDDVRRKQATRMIFFIIWFVIISVLAALFIGILVGSAETTTPVFTTAQALTTSQSGPVTIKKTSKYEAAICTMRFSAAQFSVVDLAVLSDAVYQPTAETVLDFVHQIPSLKSLQLGSYDLRRSEMPTNNISVSNINAPSGVHFAEFIEPTTNTSIIALRGTSSIQDIFTDLFLWSTPAFLVMSSYFGTLVGLWPTETVAQVVYLINNWASSPNDIYWYNTEQVVKGLVEDKAAWLASQQNGTTEFNAESSRLLITGHSLGGGLANIIAAHLILPAVSFSAPGLGYSTLSFNITNDALTETVVNIIPNSDPVPKFDKQVGFLQSIECNAGQPAKCHSIERTIDTLIGMCGVN